MAFRRWRSLSGSTPNDFSRTFVANLSNFKQNIYFYDPIYGTPNLTVDDMQLYVCYLLQLICFVLRVNTEQNRCKNPTDCLFVLLSSYGKYYTTKQNKAKLFFNLRPLSPTRTPAIHRGFGAVDTFKQLRSGPDQARHLPEAPVPRPRKSVQSHTRGVPRAASHDCIAPVERESLSLIHI